MVSRRLTPLAFGAAVIGLAGCAAVSGPAVPVSYIDKPLFERIEIGFTERTETLEVALDPLSNELSLTDRRRLRGFVRAYKDHGHGPLNLLLPESTHNQQYAVGALADARAIAYENGVDYQQIVGGAKFGNTPTLVMSFQSFETVMPDCKGFGEVDFADIRSNNDLPNLGCAVRTNIAAMIADPADLRGNRPLDPGDAVRRQTTFDAYRAGEQTASERNDGESGTVSEVVDEQ